MLNRVDKCLRILDQIDLSDFDQKTEHINQTQNINANTFVPQKGTLPSQIMDALSKLNIKSVSQTHAPVMTSEEHKKVIVNLSGILCKNLLVAEKRTKTQRQFLLVYPANYDRIDLKVFGKSVGVGGGLRAVDDASITFSMKKGCITPLAVLFDSHNIVECILDSSLSNSNILIHPGTNEATISMQSSDLEKYCKTHAKGKLVYEDFNKFIGEKAKETDKILKEQLQSQNKGKNKGKQNNKNQKKQGKGKGKKKGTNQEGITFDKYTQFGDWYKEIVTKCELIDYTDISGCYVLRPLSYFIWEQIQSFMDLEIKKRNVRNAYFPLFVSEDALRSESKHFADFNPEVAWVTHSGDTLLDKKIAVRPTSETIMYPMFSRWIRSFRDLPLKINQWCNVVRWEFKNATPFLRTREFLWQEGHTAHATQKEADEEVYAILDIYARTYYEMCAIPTIKGIKTPLETFPGADYSTTVEAYIPGSGRGIQGATSHCLGKNFAKMFDITFEEFNEQSKKSELKHVIQTSWGFTTRSVGVMVMNHSDDRGLVLPPKCAMYQCVIVAIINKKMAEKEREIIVNECNAINDKLHAFGVRSFVDERVGKGTGYKFCEWELKGVPVRVEVGPKDLENGVVQCARRDEREEKTQKLQTQSMQNDGDLCKNIADLLDEIHGNLYAKAKKKMDDAIVDLNEWNEFLKQIENGKIVRVPHCCNDKCEELISIETKEYFANRPDQTGVGQTGKAKALCIPLEQKEMEMDTKCVHCKDNAKKWILFGRSY